MWKRLTSLAYYAIIILRCNHNWWVGELEYYIVERLITYLRVLSLWCVRTSRWSARADRFIWRPGVVGEARYHGRSIYCAFSALTGCITSLVSRGKGKLLGKVTKSSKSRVFPFTRKMKIWRWEERICLYVSRIQWWERWGASFFFILRCNVILVEVWAFSKIHNVIYWTVN